MVPDRDEVPVDALRSAVHDETVTSVERTAHNAAAATARRWLPWTVLLVLVIAILTSITVGVAVNQLGGRVAAAESEVSELRRLAEAAKTAGDEANAQLAVRGEKQVPIPEPGTGEDSEVLVAAATARVLASLPDLSPSEAELAAAVVRTAAANREMFMPGPQQIAAKVAEYLAAYPPPAGPTGATGAAGVDGQPGRDGADAPPPTAEQLQAAVAAHLRDNPDALCPLGGRFAQLRVQLSDGGTADTWTCVVQVQPPATTTTTEPILLPPPGR